MYPTAEKTIQRTSEITKLDKNLKTVIVYSQILWWDLKHAQQPLNGDEYKKFCKEEKAKNPTTVLSSWG